MEVLADVRLKTRRPICHSLYRKLVFLLRSRPSFQCFSTETTTVRNWPTLEVRSATIAWHACHARDGDKLGVMAHENSL